MSWRLDRRPESPGEMRARLAQYRAAKELAAWLAARPIAWRPGSGVVRAERRRGAVDENQLELDLPERGMHVG